MKIEIDQMYLALKEKGKSTKAGKSKQGPLVKEGYRSVCRFCVTTSDTDDLQTSYCRYGGRWRRVGVMMQSLVLVASSIYTMHDRLCCTRTGVYGIDFDMNLLTMLH
jgi:hypothetical protein